MICKTCFFTNHGTILLPSLFPLLTDIPPKQSTLSDPKVLWLFEPNHPMAPGVRRARGGRGRQKRQTWGQAWYAVWSDPLPLDLAAFVVTLCMSAVFTAATAVLHTASAAGLQMSTVVSSVVCQACEEIISALGVRVCFSCIRLGFRVASGRDFFTAASAVLGTAAAAGLHISTVVSSVVGQACEDISSALGARVCFSCIRLGRLLAVRLSCCGQRLLACDRIVQLMILVCLFECVGAMDPAGVDVHAAAASSAAVTLTLSSVVAGALIRGEQTETGDSTGTEGAAHDESSRGASSLQCRYCSQGAGEGAP